MIPEKIVELRPAYSWDCDECGVENFTRGVLVELSAEDIEQLREVHGVEPWETGDFIQMPDQVTCRHCGAVFRPAHFKEA